jgi:Delta14-sterol reductase
MWVSIALVMAGHVGGLFDLTYIYHNLLQLTTAAIAVSYLLSIYLYVSSFIGNKRLALGGNTGNMIYDFYIGRELNPRIASLDLKEVCELRPGLIGWALINIAMALHQYQTYGYVASSMVLVLIFQGIYVIDALYNEVSQAMQPNATHVY